VTDRLVFRDAAGRELTVRDLEGHAGRVRWEVIGDNDVPPQARRYHEGVREAGRRGDYARALDLFDQAWDLAPDWPYPPYDAASPTCSSASRGWRRTCTSASTKWRPAATK
jgi:hypothetical protein